MRAKVLLGCAFLCVSGAFAVDQQRQTAETLSNAITRDDDGLLVEKASEVEIAVLDNYSLERHAVTTEDGYILTLHRIAGGPGRPVLLQHGLLGSAEEWLVSEKSLAYALADLGYDVWLGNARGNTYSKKHQTLATSDPQFWNFTWQELGRYDLPAVISYITHLRNDSLYYVGHSMGVTTFSVMAIERPEIAKNVMVMIGLAPATYVYHIAAPIRLVSPFWNVFQRTLQALGINEFIPRNPVVNIFANYICESSIFQNVVCSNLLFLIGGFNPDQLDYSLLPKIWRSFPSGTSVKLYTHWMQQMVVNEFQKFDYGEEGNLRMYNSHVPPKYDLSKLRVSSAVFWSKNDWLVGEEDAYHFYEQLPMKLGIYEIDDDSFNHFDFLWANNIPELMHAKILNLFANYENQIIKNQVL